MLSDDVYTGKSFNDSRDELFENFGVSAWTALEKGYNKFLNDIQCETCGNRIFTVYYFESENKIRIRCWECKKEEPKRNYDTTAANKALDRARRRDAVPENLTKEEKLEIKKIYELRKKLSEETGIEHHVDHIIPICKGGKHHPNNLRVITATENLKKGAKLDQNNNLSLTLN